MINKYYKVAIVGASGYTGAELARLLVQHPQVEIKYITSQSHAGKRFSDLHPQFRTLLDHTLVKAEDISPIAIDIIFLALPHGISMRFVKEWHQSAVKIIDLSGDFRLEGAQVYQEWYKREHVFPEGFESAIYGLPELNEAQIKDATLIANPGCYPTASILSLAPLYANKCIVPETVVIDAKSGTTGAGVKPGPGTHFSTVNDNFKAYGISSHRHTIEIEEQLSTLLGGHATVQFTPHLLPLDRGILVTAYAKVREGLELDQEKLSSIYSRYYGQKPFVRLRQHPPSLKDVRGSNYCDIFVQWDARTRNIIVVAVIDNLVKGASGQAIQNMNLMLGLDQTIGLAQVPIQP